ncbi:NUDIX hydrolase [Pedobacter sp.]|uniref:NUDIX hydrolase n=1 Tax=Pedobacter sp. TaxID=1411316 RepID=UPI003D7FFB3C
MAQKYRNYRIYINDSSLFIADSLPDEGLDLQLIDVQSFDFITFYKNLDKGAAKHYLLRSDDPKATFKKLKDQCLLIKAAGGLVKSGKGNYLFILRNKKWDLPKGKVESGEKMKEAALREVEEECGVKILTNDEKLCRTYHIYEMGGKVVLKKTNWYSMTVKGQPKLIPQQEEGITKAGWYGKDALGPLLSNTYQLILDVLKAGKLL